MGGRTYLFQKKREDGEALLFAFGQTPPKVLFHTGKTPLPAWQGKACYTAIATLSLLIEERQYGTVVRCRLWTLTGWV